MLSFQGLDVYRCSIEFLAYCHRDLTPKVPRGNGPLLDQLKRAGTSIALNIAEATGRTGDSDQARAYAIARGSAMECAAVVDVLAVLRLADAKALEECMALLERVVAMLTRLCR